jgi:hypothetical protein
MDEGNVKLEIAALSKPSVYEISPVALIVATRFTLLVPVTAWVFVESTTKVQLRVWPAETTWPFVVAPSEKVTVQLEPHWVLVVIVPIEILFSSRKVTPLKKLEDVAAVPEKVTTTVLTEIGPAASAVKDKVASWSLEILPRPVVAPSGVAAKVKRLRKTVFVLPAALVMVEAACLFEVAPKATTTCEELAVVGS